MQIFFFNIVQRLPQNPKEIGSQAEAPAPRPRVNVGQTLSSANPARDARGPVAARYREFMLGDADDSKRRTAAKQALFFLDGRARLPFFILWNRGQAGGGHTE